MAKEQGKYPTWHIKGKMHNSNARYVGSGALHDRVMDLDARNSTERMLPGRGADGAILKPGVRSFENSQHIDQTPLADKRKNESAPGMHDSVPMRLGKTHGFRAHNRMGHESEKALVGKDSGTMLRFSGNKACHRIGNRKGGRFNKENFHTAGLPSVNGELKQAFGENDMGKSPDKKQIGGKSQPRGHKSVQTTKKEAKVAKRGRSKVPGNK